MSSAPRSDCSASTECGGTRSATSCGSAAGSRATCWATAILCTYLPAAIIGTLVCDLPSVPIAAGVRWREFKHKGAALAPSVDYLCVACRYFVDRSVQKQIIFLDSRIAEPGQKEGPPGPSWLPIERLLLLAEHRDGDRDGDVGVQRDLDREVAHLLERPLRHAHVGALDLVALALQRLHDVVVRDRAEEPPIGARLLRDLERKPVELGAALLCLGERPGLRFLELGAARFERFQVRLVRALRLALRDEVVAREAVLHLHHVA